MTWHEFTCPCGARVRWYGHEREAAFLRRMFERQHNQHAKGK
jgi:hypothetical protein